jgi:hypothetical protein
MGLRGYIRGAKKVFAGLRNTRNIVQSQSKQSTNEMAQEVVGILQVYPPESEANKPPPPFYTRTNKLRDGWNIQESPGRVTIDNPVPYVPWVHGTSTQAWFHKLRGWKTFKQVLKQVGIGGDENTNQILLKKGRVASLAKTVETRIKSLFN